MGVPDKLAKDAPALAGLRAARRSAMERKGYERKGYERFCTTVSDPTASDPTVSDPRCAKHSSACPRRQALVVTRPARRRVTRR